MKNLLLDYIKFEKRFREGYMLSAPQIYYSGLVFAPQDSLVIQLYSSLFHNLITVSGDIDIVWPPSEPLVIHGISKVTAVAFSPDGTHIVSGSHDGKIRVWNPVTGQQIGKALRGHEDSVYTVAFSPDGTQILSGSSDKTIRVWDVVTGQQVGEALRGHEGLVLSVAFSPDGTQIVSGSEDKTIRVWDVVTGQQVGEALRGHKDWVRSVAFSPDGMQIVSGSDDKSVVMEVNTHLTCPQFHYDHDWFHFGKKETQSYILWIPHSLRRRDFILYPCNMVMTVCPKITIQFKEDAWDDWAMIKM